VTPCARGSRSRERRPGITWGCPNRGKHQTTPITCHFCAMQRDLMCDATYVTLEHTRFCPQCGVSRGAVRGKKAAISGEIGLFGPLFGPFSSDFRNPVPASGHVCDVADFGGIRTASAHIFASTPPPCTSVRGRPGQGGARRFDRAGARHACFRSVPGIGNRSTPSRVAARKRCSARPRARLRLARHSGSRPRRGRGPVVRRARY
jgi:hypothetical protein